MLTTAAACSTAIHHAPCPVHTCYVVRINTGTSGNYILPSALRIMELPLYTAEFAPRLAPRNLDTLPVCAVDAPSPRRLELIHGSVGNNAGRRRCGQQSTPQVPKQKEDEPFLASSLISLHRHHHRRRLAWRCLNRPGLHSPWIHDCMRTKTTASLPIADLPSDTSCFVPFEQ